MPDRINSSYETSRHNCPRFLHRVHFLTCGTSEKALVSYNQSIAPLRPLPGIVIANLCADLQWRGYEMKLDAVLQYAESDAVHPRDLLIFTDADALVNNVVAASADGLIYRFEQAWAAWPRARVIFQAEAFCWAPWSKKWPAGRVCSPEVVKLYSAYDYHNHAFARCPRYLNSGMYAGLAGEMLPIIAQWRAGAAVLSGKSPGAAWPGAPPTCYRGDQCVVTNLLLRSNGTIALDTREHLFASAATPAVPGDAEWGAANRGGGAIRCGDTRCRATARVEVGWQLDGNRNGNSLSRFPEYRQACKLSESPPVLIHFQGVAKSQLDSQFVRRWLRFRANAFSAELRVSATRCQRS